MLLITEMGMGSMVDAAIGRENCTNEGDRLSMEIISAGGNYVNVMGKREGGRKLGRREARVWWIGRLIPYKSE